MKDPQEELKLICPNTQTTLEHGMRYAYAAILMYITNFDIRSYNVEHLYPLQTRGLFSYVKWPELLDFLDIILTTVRC